VNGLEELIRAAEVDLRAAGARFALVGGLAVSARAEPRFTRDCDVAVAVPSDAEAEALVLELLARGWRVAAQLEQEDARRLASVRLLPPAGIDSAHVLDLLFASSGIEPEIVEAASVVAVVGGLELPVASRAHLIALKVLARDDALRPQDRADLSALVALASEDEVRAAGGALRTITERGFHRGRDLLALLDELLGGR
jgi:predicted nucleotidyltransferase